MTARTLIAVCGMLACVDAPGPSCLRRSAEPTDTFLDGHRAAVAAGPSGVRLTLGLVDGRSSFHQGDPVDLELAFTGDPGLPYLLSLRTYDRSGRLPDDTFVVDRPLDVTDPLYDYYHFGLTGFIGGGLSAVPEPLSASPQVVRLQANEWMRFEHTGRYQLYIRSTRLMYGPGAAPPEGRPWPTVASSLVSFEILPPRTTPFDVVTTPARLLRFADTAEAVREMVRRLRSSTADSEATRVGTEAFECRYGLFGTRHRAVAVQELERLLADKGSDVGEPLLRMVATLSAMLELPTRVFAETYPMSADEQAYRQRQQDAFDRALRKYRAQAGLAERSSAR